MAVNTRDLKICIIGAGLSGIQNLARNVSLTTKVGMGGLTSALALAKQGFTSIEVFETASSLGFVGAGIQLAPNMARVLDRLGVWSDIEQDAVKIYETSIREGSDDSELGHVDLSNVKELYGYPHQVGHRSSLAGSIYEGCKREGAVKFHFSTSVSDLKDFSPKPSFTVTPRSSDVQPYEVHCDILLACDGVKSVCRGRMLEGLGTEDAVADSGQAAYRIMLTREQMQHDAELLELLDSDRVTRWIGPRRHMIAYPVQGKTIYNISTAQSDVNFAAAPSATYTTRGSKTAMKDVFDDFCPLVQRMLELVPEGEVCEWKLRVHSPLPTWVHGSVALVGDACHPTLPHLNQGAAQAIEDAAVIAVCLSHLQDTEPASITKALKCYEKVRKERAERLVEMAAFSGKTMQLGEGAAKQERDRQFAALKEGKGPVPDKWADSEVQRMIFGFDCVRAAEDFMAPRH